MSLLTHLARFIATDPLDADAETLGVLRDGVIDTFGCILAGADQPVARAAGRAVLSMCGQGSSPVFGTSHLGNRAHAAFLNAVAGHALDFDDWEVPGNTHPTVVLLPALLASAPDQTSGAELARAYIAGFEVIARLGEALNFDHYDRGWHSTATLGAIGAAGGVARLLHLDADQTAHALSIAVSRAAGYTCQFGSDTKPMQAGFAAQTGVEAAHLAQAGLTGQSHVLDHPRGMNALMAGVSPDRLKAVAERLGHGLALSAHKLVLKPWPSCGYTHRLMTAALEMSDQNSDLSEIAKIDLHLPDFHAEVLPFGQPTRREEALFSAPFVVAMGLRHQRLGLSDITSEAWTAPDIKTLIGKTFVHPFTPSRPDLNYDPDEPDRIVVTFRSGAAREQTCAYPLGAPQNPMSAADIRAKFQAIVPASRATHQDAVFNWLQTTDITTAFTSPETPR